MNKRWLAAAIALLFLLQGACFAAVDNIADSCRFWVSEGNAGDVSDASMTTAWSPKGANPELRVMLPDSGAAHIQIHWTLPPTNYTLTEYDASQNVVATRTAEDDSFACIAQLLPLQKETRYISLTFSQASQGINKIRIFPEGELPNTVVQWEAPHDKCDLLIISTHQDDEWLWFGAMIPYYDLVMDKDVQVVYMANCGRYRYAEALNSLAVSGVRTYPLFIGLKDRRDDSLEAAVRTWNGVDTVVGVMVAIIRRCKPEVILTHDWNGEYGHPQHILTSRSMEYAIAAAADPAQYPESAEAYGAWQVKKLYRHLETKDQIQFDWHVAYPEFGGRTGLQVAIDSMNEHASQLPYFQVKDHGEYDNALFGLSYSTVGNDVEHKDLFENISDAPSTPEPTPEVTPEATPEVTEEAADVTGEALADDEEPVETVDAEATPEPTATAEPMSTPEPQPAKERGGNGAIIAVGIALAVACVGVAGWMFYSRQQARRRRRKRRRRR